MEKLAFKIKISVLWLLFTGGMSASMILWLMGPGKIEGIMAGEMEGMQITAGLSMFFALFWLIPMIMAFLSLVLRYSANRWSNFVLGIIFALFDLFDVIGHLSRGELGGHMLMGLGGIVVPALIAWYAWKWPKEEA